MGGNCDGTYFDELYYGEPVHEPATMLLLGFGVVLFAGCSGKFVKTWGVGASPTSYVLGRRKRGR
jgi:hypothetical protein